MPLRRLHAQAQSGGELEELPALNQPFSASPADLARLPAVSFVVPDQRNDMHDGSIAEGDAWLKRNLDAYA